MQYCWCSCLRALLHDVVCPVKDHYIMPRTIVAHMVHLSWTCSTAKTDEVGTPCKQDGRPPLHACVHNGGTSWPNVHKCNHDLIALCFVRDLCMPHCSSDIDCQPISIIPLP